MGTSRCPGGPGCQFHLLYTWSCSHCWDRGTRRDERGQQKATSVEVEERRTGNGRGSGSGQWAEIKGKLILSLSLLPRGASCLHSKSKPEECSALFNKESKLCSPGRKTMNLTARCPCLSCPLPAHHHPTHIQWCW